MPTKKNELAISDGPPMSELERISNIIFRVSKEPNVNMDVLERLEQMLDRFLNRSKEDKFNASMAAAQSEMYAVAPDAQNTQTKSKYATYAAIDKVVRPIYTRHGFALSFDTGKSELPNHILVVCYVTCAGFTRRHSIDMPADGKGAKGGDVMSATHAVGSAFTYGQRYLLKGIFNLAIGGDDDGNAAGGETINMEQAIALKKKMDEVGAHLDNFCNRFKIDEIASLPAKKFAEAMDRLSLYGEAKAKKEAEKAHADN